KSTEHKLGNPTVMTAWHIEAFSTRERFDRLLEELCDNVKSNPPAEGYEDVLLPGEYEYRNTQHRIKEGIPLPESLWQELEDLAG
ncbi:MAG: Ldh family oxidoreductase, partial [Cyanothece sp. SIO1E1]|nr:Ldh family oxidoreductase [Cyanothece sp. SIO1E1]